MKFNKVNSHLVTKSNIMSKMSDIMSVCQIEH